MFLFYNVYTFFCLFKFEFHLNVHRFVSVYISSQKVCNKYQLRNISISCHYTNLLLFFLSSDYIRDIWIYIGYIWRYWNLNIQCFCMIIFLYSSSWSVYFSVVTALKGSQRRLTVCHFTFTCWKFLVTRHIMKNR